VKRFTIALQARRGRILVVATLALVALSSATKVTLASTSFHVYA
jgi:hypothetical protein